MADRTVHQLDGVDWYDYPEWYDILHWPGTEEEADGLIQIAKQFCSSSKSDDLSFFEPACGTARHLRALGTHGHACVGLDSNEKMLTYGRERANALELGNFTLVNGDMTRFDSGDVGKNYDLAFCLANSIRHIQSDELLIRHLQNVRQTLRNGGAYAVGVGLTGYELESPSEDIWFGERAGTKVTQAVQYEPATREARTERVISQLCVIDDQSETHVSHEYDLHAMDASQWSSIVDESGFHVKGVVDDTGELVDWWDWESGAYGYGVFILAPL